MNEITLYLDKTTKAEFYKWFMNEYADIAGTFAEKPTIDLSSTFEFERGVLKARIYYSGAKDSPPILDLLKAIRADFIVLDNPADLNKPTQEYKEFYFRLSKATINNFWKSVQTAKVTERITSGGRDWGIDFYDPFCIGVNHPMLPNNRKWEILHFEFTPIGEGLRVNVHYSGIEHYRPYFVGLFREIAKDWTDSQQEINKAIAELTGQPADLDVPTNEAAKVEKPKTRKKKKLKLPSRYGDAEKWVLAWEVLESLIDNDLTLKIDCDELRPRLKAQGLNFRGDKTLKDIIALGRQHGIPSLLEFEQKHKK